MMLSEILGGPSETFTDRPVISLCHLISAFLRVYYVRVLTPSAG
jgi:hypothetical protein